MTDVPRSERVLRSEATGGATRVAGGLPGASPAPQAASAAALAAPDLKRSGRPPWRGNGAIGYLFLLPYLTLLFAFLLLPLGYGLWLSLMRYEMLAPEAPQFVGLGNYLEALQSEFFWQAAGATALFVVMAVPLTVGLALLIAVGLNAVPGRRQEFYRLCVFLPTMITVSVAGLIWRWFYNSEFGLLNTLLAQLHGSIIEANTKVDWLVPNVLMGWSPKIPWIIDPTWAMPSVVLMTLWWTIGGPVIILLAGLKQIPGEYYEAGAIDGAVGWRRFLFITLPLLRPVLLFVLVINIIGAFQVFGQTFIITRGGPANATRVLMQYVYETSFTHYRLGYGAAMSWLLFLAIAVFSLLQFRAMRER